jgi:hypothetical protein
MAGRKPSRQHLSSLPEALAVVLDRGVLDPQTVLQNPVDDLREGVNGRPSG